MRLGSAPTPSTNGQGDRIAGEPVARASSGRSRAGLLVQILVLICATLLHISIASAVLVEGLLPLPGVHDTPPEPSAIDGDHLPSRLACVSYDPRHRFFRLSAAELARGMQIPPAWIDEDLRRIANLAKCIRTYSATRGMENVPEIAMKYGLDVVIGADVTADVRGNDDEIDSVISLTKRFSNIKRVIVGNEVLHHNWMKDHALFVQPHELYRLLDKAQEAIAVPISTAETRAILLDGHGQQWNAEQEIAKRVDFIAINHTPLWGGVERAAAAANLSDVMERLAQRYERKELFLAEVGWPTGGPQIGRSISSRAEMLAFVNDFVAWSTAMRIDYNYCEAFDQPWKIHHYEGRLGGQWGLLTASGRSKLGSVGGVGPWSLVPAAFAFAFCLYVVLSRPWLRLGSAVFLFVSTHALLLCIAWDLNASVREYLHHAVAFWLLIAMPTTALLFAFAILALDAVEVFSRDELFDSARLRPEIGEGPLPFVSIHVPCSREPPEMVCETLKALLALKYPAFEVIVMDNNTTDPELYSPVAEFCALHSDKLRFFHEDHLPGFKSGALNFALARTSPSAAIIAVIDSDYVVAPNWLSAVVPFFDDPTIAVVQAPQAYRDWKGMTFPTMMRCEYQGFFETAMIQRGARNAIVQLGTMVTMRRETLSAVGGWAEWCITEDTELGLRILLAGHKAVFVPEVFGEGLLPRSADAYFRQRFRWVAGAMSIVRRYWKELVGLRPGLSREQRYCFLAGWLPWILDCAAPAFSVLGMAAGVLWLWKGLFIPPVEMSYPFLCFFVFRVVTTLAVSAMRIRIGVRATFLATLSGIALTWVIAAAALRGLSGRALPFYRTQKSSVSERPVRNSWIWWFLTLDADVLGFTILAAMSAALVARDPVLSGQTIIWGGALILVSLPLAASGAVRALGPSKARGR